MNDQHVREVMTAWLDGKEIECWSGDELRLTVKFPNLPRLTYRWRIKPDYPPRPTDEQLLEWGVRIVGDEPRVPKEVETYVAKDCTCVIGYHHCHSGLRWIVEPIPKEPQGKWVECEVEYNCVNVLSFDSPWNDVDTRITDAPSIEGFGGYLYDGRWSLRMKAENNPPTNGAVIIKPEKVRFWVTEGGK